MRRFKNRVYYTLIGVATSIALLFILGSVIINLIPNSAGLAGIGVILGLVELGLLILPILALIFFFIGYRKDLKNSKNTKLVPWYIQLTGLLVGSYTGVQLHGLFITWMFNKWPVQYDENSGITSEISLYSIPVSILVYAAYGFVTVQFFYYLLHFHSKKYLALFLISTALIIPVSVILLFINK